jgi:hypothetical protein
VAVRSFAGSTDVIKFPWTYLTGAGSYACLVKLSVATVTNVGLVQQHNSVNNGIMGGLGINTGGTLPFYINHNNSADPATSIGTGTWTIVVATKTAGTTTPRFHFFPIGGAQVHQNGGVTIADPTLGGTPELRLGKFQTTASLVGLLAVAAVWSVALSDAEVNALATNLKTQDWANTQPGALQFLVDLNQASTATAVVDLSGHGRDQSAITGTTVDTGNDPPGWTFGAVTAANTGYGDNSYGAGSYGVRADGAPAVIPLGTAAATSSASLALKARTLLTLETAAATSGGPLYPDAGLYPQAGLYPGNSSAGGVLALSAKTQVPLGAAAAQSSATIFLFAGLGVVPLQAAVATSSATLSLKAQTQIVLGAAVASAGANLTITAGPPFVPLGPSAGHSSATLLLRGGPYPAFPTGKFVIKNASVVIAGVDVSRCCSEVRFDQERGDPIEITGYGATYKEFLPGFKSAVFSFQLFADPAIITPAFWTALNSTDPVWVEVTARGFEGGDSTNPLWSAFAIATTKRPLYGAVGEAARAAIELHSTGDIFELAV